MLSFFQIICLLMTVLCFSGIAYAVRGMILHLLGRPILSRTNDPAPFVIWPFFLFVMFMFLAGLLPVLFGQPYWLLDRVFALISGN